MFVSFQESTRRTGFGFTVPGFGAILALPVPYWRDVPYWLKSDLGLPMSVSFQESTRRNTVPTSPWISECTTCKTRVRLAVVHGLFRLHSCFFHGLSMFYLWFIRGAFKVHHTSFRLDLGLRMCGLGVGRRV